MPPEAPAGEIQAVTFARFEGKLDQVIIDHARRIDKLEENTRAAGGKVMGWLGLAASMVAVVITLGGKLT